MKSNDKIEKSKENLKKCNNHNKTFLIPERYFKDDEKITKKKVIQVRNLYNIHSYKTLINIKTISILGNEDKKNKIKDNQDNYFIIPQLNDCKEIKVFGILDGHRKIENNLIREIKNYFQNYFINLFNNKNKNENNIEGNIIYGTKINKNKELLKIKFNESEEKKKQNLFVKLKVKSDKINKIYNKLITNSFSEILLSYTKLDEIFHMKYSNSNIYRLYNKTSLILFLFNSKICNKIIISNLGDSKIILISKKNNIKELNKVPILNEPNKKNKSIEYGGTMEKLSVGLLEKQKYSRLSIIKSFKDFNNNNLDDFSIPDIKEYDLDKEDIKILIFGTGLFWKYINNETLMNIILPYYEQNNIEGAEQKIKEEVRNVCKIKTEKKLPHMGWNELYKNQNNAIIKNIDEGEDVYFVHSFMADFDEENVIAYTKYGNVKIPAIVGKDNVIGCQFHPEKSGLIGEKILRNWKEMI